MVTAAQTFSPSTGKAEVGKSLSLRTAGTTGGTLSQIQWGQGTMARTKNSFFFPVKDNV